MLRAHSLRYLLVAALFFAFGTVHVSVAITTASDHQLHRQDVGDDDGDGIPNYLDPDDNNDGLQDRDTPAPPVVPDPPVDESEAVTPDDDDAVVEDETNQEQTPDPNGTTDTDDHSVQEDTPVADTPVVEAPVVEEAQTAPVSQQVTSLPDTGAGFDDSSRLWSASMILTLLITGIVAVNLNSKNRKS